MQDEVHRKENLLETEENKNFKQFLLHCSQTRHVLVVITTYVIYKHALNCNFLPKPDIKNNEAKKYEVFTVKKICIGPEPCLFLGGGSIFTYTRSLCLFTGSEYSRCTRVISRDR